MLWCFVASNSAIHFCMVLRTLTSPNWNKFRIDWSLLWRQPPYTCSVPLLRSLHWLPITFRLLFKTSLLICKTLWNTACLSSLRSCPITPIRFTEIKQRNQSVGPQSQDQHTCKCISLFGTTSCCLSVPPLQLQPPKNVSRYISLTWPPHIDNSTPDGQFDVMELVYFEYRFGCCSNWAWRCRWCLPYKKIDCLIQSINQSNFYSANISSEARLRGATAKSVFNSKIEETVP